MNELWTTNVETYLEIMQLAKKRGKRVGDSMQAEFDEIKAKYPEKFKSMGAVNTDVDLLTGNLREEGHKILNLNEVQKQVDNDRNV